METTIQGGPFCGLLGVTVWGSGLGSRHVLPTPTKIQDQRFGVWVLALNPKLDL